MSDKKFTLIDNTLSVRGKGINISNLKKFIPSSVVSSHHLFKSELIDKPLFKLEIVDTNQLDIERAENEGMNSPNKP